MREILKLLGNFGNYQAFFYALCFVPGFLGGASTLIYQWTGFIPGDHRCRLPDEPLNSTYDWAMDNGQNYRYSPQSQCTYCVQTEFDHDNDTWNCQRTELCAGSSVVIRPETALVPNSFAVRHHLMCADVWMQRLVWSLNTIGFAIGAAIFGTLSDRYGRRKIFLITSVMFIIAANVTPFVHRFELYCAMQVAIGALNTGCYLTMYIIFMEVVGGMPRTLCGVWYQGMFTCGMLWDGLIAYAISDDWQLLQWLACMPTIFLLAYYWLLPESMRWLVVNNKPSAARKTVLNAAKMNGVEMPETLLKKEIDLASQDSHTSNNASLLDLFSHWRLAKNTAIVFFSWFATSMGFYGLSQNTSDLPGSPYFTYTLGALVEFPGYAICVPLMEYIGRRPTLVILFGVGGISCITAGLINDALSILVLALIGKMCVAAVFAVIYNYSAEIFPTVVRQTGCGYASVCARLGSLLAPQIRLLGDYVHPSLPILIFGACSVMAAILDLFLPETLNTELPETIQDGIDFGKAPMKSTENGPVPTDLSAEKLIPNDEFVEIALARNNADVV